MNYYSFDISSALLEMKNTEFQSYISPDYVDGNCILKAIPNYITSMFAVFRRQFLLPQNNKDR